MTPVQIPLAELMRPSKIEDVIGQEHLLGEEGFIAKSIKAKKPSSIILWGPPGSGKTSIARLYAKAFDFPFHTMSSILNGAGTIRKIIQDAEESPLFGRTTILFVDEIHRYNKAQQDIFLPYVENGRIILIGATTENPSFYLNSALLSRLRVLPLYTLDTFALNLLLERYEKRFSSLCLNAKAKECLIDLSQGDGRYLFNLVETIKDEKVDTIDESTLERLLQRRSALFDKQGDAHYNLISALHKSVRGSDPDAALYWFCRILQGGEAPLYLARRIIRMAAEDIGLADPQALQLAIAAKDTYEMLGSPEGELALAEALIYLALAPKSNRLYKAYGEARKLAEKTSHLPPPKTILNAPTSLMKEMGYGKGYSYDHDTKQAFSGQNYFPEGVERAAFYAPSERGFEKELKKRATYLSELRAKLHSAS